MSESFEKQPSATGSRPEGSEANQEQIIASFNRLRQGWSREAKDYQENRAEIDAAIEELDTP